PRGRGCGSTGLLRPAGGGGRRPARPREGPTDGALGDGEPASVRLVQAHGVVAGRAAARPRTVVVEFLLDAAAHLGPEQGRAGLLDGRGERVDALQGGLGLLGALAE